MKVSLVSITPEAEKIIAYCARVSSTNQDNPNIAGLLKYCIRHGHWSVFEMANMTLEIETSRAMARQIIRHRSFSFQEFSQRYQSIDEASWETNREEWEARRQDTKNRQNSIDDLDEETKKWFRTAQVANWNYAHNLYKKALEKGIAKECARVFLPEGQTKTRMYMQGSVRSWLHFIDLRTGNGTQLEHVEIAEEAKKVFIEQLPTVASAMGWKVD